jgi:hypothetical protein
MPTRERYISDPDYVQACESVFGAPPDKPYFELFIPVEYREHKLLSDVQRPIWTLETDVIWPKIASILAADGVRGDLLEFGVFNGSSLRRLVEIFRPLGIIDRFYGFDSFEGLPPPDPASDVGYWTAGSFSNTSVETVSAYLQQGLGEISDVELIKGWFDITLPLMKDRINSIAFVRVDCDLYKSTVDMFGFLSGRLVDGSVLYFDDWTHDHRTGETRAFFEFARREKDVYGFERILTVSDGAIAVRVRHRS